MVTSSPKFSRILSLFLPTLFFCMVPLGAMDIQTSMPLVAGSVSSPGILLFSLESEGLIFNAHEDGEVEVLTAPGLRPVQIIHTGLLGIRQIAAHPGGTLAILDRDPVSLVWTLWVWDWKTGIARFSRPLEGQGLWFSLMDEGQGVLISQIALRSLVRLDIARASELPLPMEIRGIFDFFLLSAREDKIMTYSALSGELHFNALADGKELLAAKVGKGLTMTGIYPDGTRRYAIYLRASTLGLLEVSSGRTVAELELPGTCIAAWPWTAEPGVMVLYRDAGGKGRTLAYCTLHEGKLVNTRNISDLPPGLGTMNVYGDQLVASLNTGETAILDANGLPLARSPRTLDPIQDVLVQESRLVLKTAKGFFGIDLPELSRAGWDASACRSSTLRSPKRIWKNLDASAFNRIQSFDAKHLLLLAGNNKGRISLFDPVTEKTIDLGSTDSGFASHGFRPDSVWSLEGDSRLRLWINPLKNTSPVFSGRLPGTNGVLGMEGRTLVLSSSMNSKSGASLEILNTSTDEKIRLASPETSIVSMAMISGRKDRFLSLGTLSGSTKDVMVLRLWDLKSKNSLELARITSRDSKAALVVSPDASEILVSHDGRIDGYLLARAVEDWTGSSATSLELQTRTYEVSGKRVLTMRFGGTILFACNQDGSLSAWSRTDQRHLFDLDIFDNEDVLGLQRDGVVVPAGDGSISTPVLESEGLVYLPRALAQRGAEKTDRRFSLDW